VELPSSAELGAGFALETLLSFVGSDERANLSFEGPFDADYITGWYVDAENRGSAARATKEPSYFDPVVAMLA
jgi:hypothetical protein